MLTGCWPALLRKLATGKTAVLGIGNEWNGDDAAGVLVARGLRNRAADLNGVLIIDGGTAPENCTGTLRRFRPQGVVLVDAAFMGQQPGAVCWLEMAEIGGLSASTHSLPLHMLASYLTLEIGCAVGMIAIQPATTFFDTPLSPPVWAAVDQVTEILAKTLSLPLLPDGQRITPG